MVELVEETAVIPAGGEGYKTPAAGSRRSLVWAGGEVDGGEGSDGDSSRNGGEEVLLVRVHYGGQFGW